MRSATATLALLGAILVLAACGSDDAPSAPATKEPRSDLPIRIGTKNFTEQFILGELYRQALQAKGFRVQLKRDIGSSEIIHQALEGGALDMYPEYIGVLLSEIANVRMRPRDPAAAYRLAKAFEQRKGFTLLAMTPFSDSNALAVTPAFARRHRVRTIHDLRRVRGGVEIGAPPEFRTRYEGLIGLADRYRINNAKVVPLAIGKQYRALTTRRVDAAAVFTTDGQLAGSRYVLLDDPRGVFALQHVAPVISRRTLRAHGGPLAAALDAVSRRLTTGTMQKMNASVDLDERRPRDVADEFLRAQGLK